MFFTEQEKRDIMHSANSIRFAIFSLNVIVPVVYFIYSLICKTF